MFGGIRPPPCSFRQTFLQVSLHHAHMSSLGEHFFEQKNAFFRKSEMEAPRTILIFCFHLVEVKKKHPDVSHKFQALCSRRSAGQSIQVLKGCLIVS
jgi:hypothetical protein